MTKVERLHQEYRQAGKRLMAAAKRYALCEKDYVEAVRKSRKDKNVVEVRNGCDAGPEVEGFGGPE